MMELDQEYSAEELEYSSPLDRHRITYHPEVKTFLKDFQQTHFPKYAKARRAMLDVLLMDLYVTWYHNPEMFIGLHRKVTAYAKSTRLNKLRITRTVILVVDDLIKKGFVNQKIGFRGEYNSRISRIIALSPLVSIFKEASFNVLDITDHEGRETIILKDKDKNIIEYEDTNQTINMREDLKEYNNLLHQTHVDIANNPRNFVERKGKKNKVLRLATTQHNKFVYRVFSNGSWSEGGRYYGGWWQQLSEEQRRHICLNGKRTIEVDYSGIHIMLLYARKNINYSGTDPYTIDVPEIEDPKVRRWLVKQILLTAVNARDVPTTCAAIRSTIYKDLPDYYTLPDIKFTDQFLISIIDKLKQKHIEIADFLCTGAGIELQNTDSHITSNIINKFTRQRVPVLSVHDSYIVQEDCLDWLQGTMQEAFQEVVQLEVTDQLTKELSIRNAFIRTEAGGYLDQEFDYEEPDGGEKHQEILALKEKDLIATQAHKRRLETFNRWLNKEKGLVIADGEVIEFVY